VHRVYRVSKEVLEYQDLMVLLEVLGQMGKLDNLELQEHQGLVGHQEMMEHQELQDNPETMDCLEYREPLEHQDPQDSLGRLGTMALQVPREE